MSTREHLYAGLDGDPNDWTTRGILADLFEDEGEQDRADCLRWTIRHRKRPDRSDNGTYHWFNEETVNVDQDPESDIPAAIYTRMRAAEGLDKIYRNYKSLPAADEDFFQGWLAARNLGLIDD